MVQEVIVSAQFSIQFMHRRAQHLGFLRVLCRDEALAEELFQDLTVAVLEGVGRFRDEEGDFDAWVRGIARNLWRGHLRRQRPTSPLNQAVEEAVAAAWDDRSPQEALEQAERLGRLKTCLDSLAPGARDLVRRRYEASESSAVIAQALGRTVAAIDTALSRIRSTMLTCLGSAS